VTPAPKHKKMKALFLVPPLQGGGRNIVRDFVYGCWCNGRRIGGMQMPPLNELFVCTHARQPGLEPIFIDANLEPERFRGLLASGLSDVLAVALMSSTQSFTEDVQVLGHIKAINPRVSTILYGSHPTFMPEHALAPEVVDYIVLREPEESVRCLLSALLQGEGMETLPGIGYKDAAGQPVINPYRPFMDMDDLPIPDRTLLPQGVDYFNPVVERMPYTTMQTSRGCPGKCIFCTAPSFYGRRTRVRSAEKVLEELRVVKRQGYREVFFRDETFTAYKKRNQEICEGMLREGLDLRWIANGRVDMIDKETMRLMKRAGCHMLKFGVETGSDRILANYKKGTTCAQAEEVFRMAKEVGLQTHAHIVLGGPGETPETIKQTLEFVKKLDPTTASFGILTPYPGTELFELVARKHPEIGDGTASNMANLHVQGFYSEAICGMKGEELSRWLVRLYRGFYLRPTYLAKRLAEVRSLDRFMILFLAGLNILGFCLTGQK